MSRNAIVAAVAAAIGAASLASPAVAADRVQWNWAAWGKPRAATAQIEFIRKYVAEKTDGNFTITIGYESFGGPKELLDILKVGGLQATMMCSSYHPEKTPGYTALDLPFLPIDDFPTQQRVHEDFHKHPYVLQEFAGWNAVPFLSSVLPQYEFVGKGEPPLTIEGFKGLRVRAIGGIGDAMKQLGAIPTSVDATEVYTALERGVVDAASFPSTYAHASYKTYELGDWFTANLAPGTQACPGVVNVTAWAELPDEYKALLEEAKPAGYAAMEQAYAEADKKNIPLFQKKLDFIEYSEEELGRFRALAAEPVWEAWVTQREAQGIPGRELLEAILASARAAPPS